MKLYFFLRSISKHLKYAATKKSRISISMMTLPALCAAASSTCEIKTSRAERRGSVSFHFCAEASDSPFFLFCVYYCSCQDFSQNYNSHINNGQ